MPSNYFHPKLSEQSPEFRRSVAASAGELRQLTSKYGGAITVTKWADDPAAAERRRKYPGRVYWDGSQLPQAIEWLVTFGGAGAAGAGIWSFLKHGRKIIPRLMTLAGVTKIKLKDGQLSLDVSGAADIDTAIEHFEKLRKSPHVEKPPRKRAVRRKAAAKQVKKPQTRIRKKNTRTSKSKRRK